jgi:twitching motility protein PilT
MELNEILKVAIKGGASDIHLKSGLPPMFRVDGALVPLKNGERILPDELQKMAFSIMNAIQKAALQGRSSRVDLAYGCPGLGRFRVQRLPAARHRRPGLRVIPFGASSRSDQLTLPPVLEKICEESRGLVLVHRHDRLGQVDDPRGDDRAHQLEPRRATSSPSRTRSSSWSATSRSIVNQREIGVDTHTFSSALRAAMRQDPDVILVGEMRDFETIETALTRGRDRPPRHETLHTLDATETINRIISVFPPHQQKQVRMQLGQVLKAVISQRLVPRADGKGRVPALEVLISTALTRELIGDKDRTKELPDVIAKGHTTYGMQTFDQSLMSHVKSGLVSYEEALKHVSNPDDFALRYRGIASTSDSEWNEFSGDSAAPAEAKPDADDEGGMMDGDDFNIDRF